MKSFFKLALSAVVQGRQRQARRLAIEELDARTLRDIGLEEEAERARRRALRDRLYLGTYY
jgi:uncharacterized protein YjiS (DUF1127 family)